MKNIRVFYLIFFQFWEVKFSIYMNRRVFVMLSVISEIDINNGCIRSSYLTLVFEETGALNCSSRQQVHMQDHSA